MAMTQSCFHKVKVTHVNNPQQFIAQIGDDTSLQILSKFEERLREYGEMMSQQRGVGFLSPPLPGQMVLVDAGKGDWRRATISVMAKDEVDVVYVDHGGSEFVLPDQIIPQVPEWAHQMPLVAWECTLVHVKPIAKQWTEKAINRFTSLVLGVYHDCQLVGTVGVCQTIMDIYVELGDEMLSLSELLIREGLAQPCEDPAPQKPTNSSSIAIFDFESLKQKFNQRPVEVAESSPAPDFEREEFTRGLSLQSSEYGMGGTAYSDCVVGSSIMTKPTSSINSIRDQMKLIQEYSANMGRDQGDSLWNQPRRGGRRTARGEHRRSPAQSQTPPRRDSNPSLAVPEGVATNARKLSQSPVPRRTAGRGYGIRNSSQSLNSSSENLTKSGPVGSGSGGVGRMRNDALVIMQLLQKLADEPGSLPAVMTQIRSLANSSERSRSEGSRGRGLQVVLEQLLEAGVDHQETLGGQVLEVISQLQGDDEFSSVLSELLWKQQSTYIKVANSQHAAGLRSAYCYFIGRLYLRSQAWQDSSTVVAFVINSVEKWTTFNKTGMSNSVMSLYTECLCHLLQVVGTDLDECLPIQVKDTLANLPQIVLNEHLPRAVREKLLTLLIHQQPPQPAVPGPRASVTHVGVQTQPTRTNDVAIETDPVSTSCDTNSKSLNDPYSKVAAMLECLSLEEILPVFTENAIRDSLLTLPSDELKNLLQECGLKLGQVTEIRSYLRKSPACRRVNLDYNNSQPPESIDRKSLLTVASHSLQQQPNMAACNPLTSQSISSQPHAVELMAPGQFVTHTERGDLEGCQESEMPWPSSSSSHVAGLSDSTSWVSMASMMTLASPATHPSGMPAQHSQPRDASRPYSRQSSDSTMATGSSVARVSNLPDGSREESQTGPYSRQSNAVTMATDSAARLPAQHGHNTDAKKTSSYSRQSSANGMPTTSNYHGNLGTVCDNKSSKLLGSYKNDFDSAESSMHYGMVSQYKCDEDLPYYKTSSPLSSPTVSSQHLNSTYSVKPASNNTSSNLFTSRSEKPPENTMNVVQAKLSLADLGPTQDAGTPSYANIAASHKEIKPVVAPPKPNPSVYRAPLNTTRRRGLSNEDLEKRWNSSLRENSSNSSARNGPAESNAGSSHGDGSHDNSRSGLPMQSNNYVVSGGGDPEHNEISRSHETPSRGSSGREEGEWPSLGNSLQAKTYFPPLVSPDVAPARSYLPPSVPSPEVNKYETERNRTSAGGRAQSSGFDDETRFSPKRRNCFLCRSSQHTTDKCPNKSTKFFFDN